MIFKVEKLDHFRIENSRVGYRPSSLMGQMTKIHPGFMLAGIDETSASIDETSASIDETSASIDETTATIIRSNYCYTPASIGSSRKEILYC